MTGRFDAEIKRLNAQGLNDGDIHRALEGKITHKGINSARRRMGLPAREQHRGGVVRNDPDYIIRSFEENVQAPLKAGDMESVRSGVARMATNVGVTYRHMRRVLTRDMKLIPPSSNRKYTPEQDTEAKRLLDDHGLSYTEVWRLTGVPRDRLSRLFPGRGLSPSESRSMGWAKQKAREMGIEL